jgi:hypothetical protein
MKLLAGLVLIGLSTGTALAAPRPVVVELFTSQACSDCPPADALLKRVQAENPDILALDLHVTYWDGAAWTDPYALQSATELQQFYAALGQNSEVYTPEAVVDGQAQFVGSDADTMAATINQARTSIAAGPAVPVSIATAGNKLLVRIGPVDEQAPQRPAQGQETGAISLFGFDPARTTHVLGGENGGATLREVNVVRSITPLGTWNGQSMLFNLRPPAGEKFAVLVQNPNGTILGAGSN